MSQLENFRSVLKKGKGSDNTVPNEQPAARNEADKNASYPSSCSIPETKAKHEKMKRTSIGLPGEVHEKLKVISLWMKKEGIKDNPGLVTTVNELIDFYIRQHPSAERFLEMYYRIE